MHTLRELNDYTFKELKEEIILQNKVKDFIKEYDKFVVSDIRYAALKKKGFIDVWIDFGKQELSKLIFYLKREGIKVIIEHVDFQNPNENFDNGSSSVTFLVSIDKDNNKNPFKHKLELRLITKGRFENISLFGLESINQLKNL